MSKDQESLRSRRALRQAREAQSTQADTQQNGYPSVPLVPAPAPGSGRDSGQEAEAANESRATNDQQNQVQQQPVGQHPGQQQAEEQRPSRRRRVADSPVDAPVSKPAERTSQARTRDRETLRAYKALSEQESRKASSAPLTRRQVRQQQLEAERRAAGFSTSRLPIVPPASAGQSGPEGESASASVETPTSPVQHKTGQDRSAGSAPGPENPLNDLSVEEALAARSALVEQAKNQMAMLDASEQDPKTVDLEVLAEQKKLAERAAVLNQRAIAKQRLSEQNRQRTAQQNDPTSAHNLAMVTPLEFVNVHGMDRPVMKPPTTSHIPVITSTTQRVPRPAPGPASKLSARPAPVPPVREEAGETAVWPSRNAGQAAVGSRSNVLARAEAAARSGPSRTAAAGRQLPPPESAPGPMEEGGPISAHTAHGLEPLDSMTAGMGRGRRQRLLQVLIFALGAIALMVSLIMIMGG